MIRVNFLNLILTVVLLAPIVACKSDIEIPDRSTPKKNVTIDPGQTYQTISGFGGANQMWGTTFPNASDIKKAYGPDEADLGFSIFRVRISSNPDEWPLIVDVAKEAQKYGAKIMASPWSPPPALKSNESDVGGELLEENYQAYADHINEFIDLMSSEVVDIYAISIQNEPDIQVSYESCDWTSAQIRNFIKNHGDQITGSKLAAPESFNFNQTFTNVILNDDDAVANLDIVAGHIYGGGLGPYTTAESKGKEIWMTEYLLNLDVGDWENASEEQKWEETMTMLGTIHDAMRYNWNAYIWWYLKRYYSFIGDGTEGTTDGEILKRGYAFSQFSKFIRPGFTRIDIEDDGTGLDFTAYEGNGQIVVVMINDSNSSVTGFNLTIDGSAITSARSFTTSLTSNRQENQLNVEDGKVEITIPSRSVSTIVLE
mgnify:CR=1 FL=1